MNKTCLITGATSGLGQYLTQALAHAGWSVTATGQRSSDEVDLPASVTYVACDLASQEQIFALVDQMDGCPDMVVHSAVSYQSKGSTEFPGFEACSQIFSVNSFAPILLSQTLLRAKSDEATTSFVFVNSEAMFAADAQTGVYAASKAALRVLSSAFAGQCQSLNAAAATLLLGPLANAQKKAELAAIAQRTGVTQEEITRRFLRKSNPNLVINDLIAFESCLQSVLYVAGLGKAANGMVCRLDGGSAGSLI